MTVYCKNSETGKYHKITIEQLFRTKDQAPQAEYDPTPLDELPSGAFYGGCFEIADGVLKFIDTRKRDK